MAGRPRKIDRRRPTRAELRARNAPTPELLRHRAAAIGLELSITDAGSFTAQEVIEAMKRYGLNATSADHPLDVLLNRAELDDETTPDPRATGAKRYAAGSRFAWLWWRRYGKPFGRTVDLGADAGPAQQERPAGWEELSAEERERWYGLSLRRMEDELDRRGREVRAVTVATCCVLQKPTSPHALALLRVGLDALARARSPSVEEIQGEATEEPPRRVAALRVRR